MSGTIIGCVFCERLGRNDTLARNDLAAALADGYPVSAGHTLIVPIRHEADFFALSPSERDAVCALLPIVKALVDERYRPDGYNVGVNIGRAGGQTISHAHLHLIPRHNGDVPDPRGGVRWVLPEHAKYWKP
jgi:diadenosine tetraphosphate (Ap4A) HIT family hydrolase